MADNKENRIHKSSIEREQSQTCLSSAERETIKGSKNLNVPHLRFPEFRGEWEMASLQDIAAVNPKSNPLQNSFVYIDLEAVEKGEIYKDRYESWKRICDEMKNNICSD